MTVLEFASGTCWLSRYLNQLQCQTISCDVSQTALDIGQRLFTEYPIIGEPIAEPQFLHFDGHTINLPDESVDRIICNDGFHHIPNQEEVIAELARVLKTGGVAGFSEPGRYHSEGPQSQYEMRNYHVLENDMILSDIFAFAKKHGFTDCKAKAVSAVDFSIDEWQTVTSKRNRTGTVKSMLKSMITEPTITKLTLRATHGIIDDISVRSLFFLYKGELILDSRSYVGLAHMIIPSVTELTVNAGEEVLLPLTISNSGAAKWLTQNIRGIGVVNIGAHLYDQADNLLNIDFSRHPLPEPISPGQTIEHTIDLRFNEIGTFRLAIDMVAEQVCWFENVGSPLQFITVNVI